MRIYIHAFCLIVALGPLWHSMQAQNDSTIAVDTAEHTLEPFIDSTHADSASPSIAVNEELEAAERRVGVSKELSFVQYLVSVGQYEDAMFVLGRIEPPYFHPTSSQNDTIQYYKGRVQYFRQQFYEATQSLSKVDTASPLHTAAGFHHSLCLLSLDASDEARSVLKATQCGDNEVLREFKMYQLAAIALMQRNYTEYDSLKAGFTFSSYAYSNEEEDLQQFADDLESFKEKSPLVAGLLSAIIPGLGKAYAGYRGLPFGAFVQTVPLMIVAIETLILGGLLSPQFLIAGAVFLVFHIGQIWGSVHSVKAYKTEFFNEIDQNILYGLHVSVRRVFEGSL